MRQQKNVYSVGQVNNYIKNMFTQDFLLKRIYVRGEVSNCKYHPSGHIYFSLKDETGTMPCVMFLSFRKGLTFQLENGQSVTVLGSISVYERDGRYQLYASEIIREGAGLLYERFEQLKEELSDMGMFDPAYKKPIPAFVKRLGIVTASTGAAIRDIMNISRRRNPFIQLVLYPALVQGEGAVDSIVKGIEVLDKYGVDVIIVGRGGGSMEDLWAFNEEKVARAIFACETPVISAVGHEPDVTISDFVADARASTPSNAAEIAVPDQMELRRFLLSAQQWLAKSQEKRLAAERQRLTDLAAKRCLTEPMAFVQDKRMELLHHQQRLGDLTRGQLARKRQRFGALSAALDAMSPLKVLGRGYAVARNQAGGILKTYRDVAAGDAVTVTLGEGGFTARVERPFGKERKHGGKTEL